MIVDTMSLEEIAQELNSDYPTANRIAFYRYEKYKSLVLKTKAFPLFRHYECTTPQKKNRFFVQYSAFRRSDWKNPIKKDYCIFGRSEGLYCALVGMGKEYIYLYPPHFFSRYRERIIKRDDISNEELIHLFIDRTWGFYAELAEYVNLDELKDWEQLQTEGPIDFVGTCPDGVLFGEIKKPVCLIKTIIPECMLHPDQVEFYDRVYIRNWDNLRKMYSPIISDYIFDSEYDYYQYPEPATQEALDRLRQKYDSE